MAQESVVESRFARNGKVIPLFPNQSTQPCRHSTNSTRQSLRQLVEMMFDICTVNDRKDNPTLHSECRRVVFDAIDAVENVSGRIMLNFPGTGLAIQAEIEQVVSHV